MCSSTKLSPSFDFIERDIGTPNAPAKLRRACAAATPPPTSRAVSFSRLLDSALTFSNRSRIYSRRFHVARNTLSLPSKGMGGVLSVRRLPSRTISLRCSLPSQLGNRLPVSRCVTTRAPSSTL